MSAILRVITAFIATVIACLFLEEYDNLEITREIFYDILFVQLFLQVLFAIDEIKVK